LTRILFRWQVLIPLLVIMILGGYWSYYYYMEEIRVDPQELFVEALDKTNQAASYRFHVEVYMHSGGTQITLSDLDGERSSDGNLYLKGQMTGQEVEIYQVKDTTYFKDTISDRWMVTPGNNPLEQEKYMAEINPLSILKITEVNELQYLGRQKKVSGRPYLLTCKPKVNNLFLNSYWHQYFYKIWIDRGSKYITRVSLEAVDRKKNQDKLSMTVDFYDFNKNIKIKPPPQSGVN